MPRRTRLYPMLILVTATNVVLAACGIGAKRYEYEEELYLSLDGSARLNVNSSVPALVALHGVDLPIDPSAWLDRARVRALFTAPGVTPSVNVSRRDGRRYVHISVSVDDVHELAEVPVLASSRYELKRTEDVIEYRQTVGAAAGKAVGDVGWSGRETVGFRMHVPSEILFQNAPGGPQRGNILAWEEPLSDRLNGDTIELHVRMKPESILYTTLLLFGGTVVAAALTFAAVLWWISRRGGARLVETPS
jgi:hypothetical protein